METESTLMQNMTEEQQMQVFNLMSIAGIEDVNFAAQMLAQFNFDLDKATESLLNIQNGINKPSDPQQSGMSVEGRGIRRDDSPQMGEDLRELYKKHLQKKEDEENDPLKRGVSGMLSGVKTVFNSIIPASLKGENGGDQFMSYFRDNYEDLNKIMKFNRGSFEENIHKANENKRPLLVYVHIDDLENQTIPPIVFAENMVNFLNSKFHLLGLLAKSEAAQSVKKYVTIKGKCYFAVFRMNLLDDVQLMESYLLTNETDPEILVEQLKDVDSNFYFLMSEEDKIKNDVKRSLEEQKRRQMEMENRHHFEEEYLDYGRYDMGHGVGGLNRGFSQRSDHDYTAEQLKLEEDRMLRQMQDEEYKQVEKQIKEKQLREAHEESIKRQKEEEEMQLKALQAEEMRKREQEKEEEIALKLSRLPEEPAESEGNNIITIAFRLPDGSRIERRFRHSEKVESIYDYIDTQNIKFDKGTIRYDLIQPRPFLCLEDRSKKIEEYFEGSSQELLQIREYNA